MIDLNKLQLVGSRFFGCAKENSDWDYLVYDNTGDFTAQLISEGWGYKEAEPYYGDNWTEFFDKMIDGVKHQIHVVYTQKDYYLLMYVYNKLKDNTPFLKMRKPFRKYIFLYELYNRAIELGYSDSFIKERELSLLSVPEYMEFDVNEEIIF
jgi:hypothetical protein